MIISLLLTALFAGLCLSSPALTLVESVESTPRNAYESYVVNLTYTQPEDSSYFEAYESFEVHADSTTYTFTLGKSYWLTEVGAEIDVSSDSWSIVSLKFARYADYNASQYSSVRAISPYGFSSYQPSSSSIHVRSRSDMAIRNLVSNTNITYSSYDVVLGSNSISYIDVAYGISSSGPYNIVMNRVSLMYHIREIIYPIFSTSTSMFKDGWNLGFDAGKEEGDSIGYQRGYDKGVEDAAEFGPVNAMQGLFTTIISVPMRILNGFNDFVIWETPVTALLVSFAVMGIMLWLIKRFIK